LDALGSPGGGAYSGRDKVACLRILCRAGSVARMVSWLVRSFDGGNGIETVIVPRNFTLPELLPINQVCVLESLIRDGPIGMRLQVREEIAESVPDKLTESLPSILKQRETNPDRLLADSRVYEHILTFDYEEQSFTGFIQRKCCVTKASGLSNAQQAVGSNLHEVERSPDTVHVSRGACPLAKQVDTGDAQPDWNLACGDAKRYRHFGRKLCFPVELKQDHTDSYR
jgi:hypothetical protein